MDFYRLKHYISTNSCNFLIDTFLNKINKDTKIIRTYKTDIVLTTQGNRKCWLVLAFDRDSQKQEWIIFCHEVSYLYYSGRLNMQYHDNKPEAIAAFKSVCTNGI